MKHFGSVDQSSSLRMGDKVPLSELTLGEADAFLENLICQTQGSGGKKTNKYIHMYIYISKNVFISNKYRSF